MGNKQAKETENPNKQRDKKLIQDINSLSLDNETKSILRRIVRRD